MIALAERVGDVHAATLNALHGAGHVDLAGVLHATGIGFVADGFVRVVDPAWLGPDVPRFFADPGGAVPFATTALGDIVLARANGVAVAQLRTGRVLPLAGSATDFLHACESSAFRLAVLHAVAYLGRDRPALHDAYFATPLEALGGSGAASTLQPADLRTAWRAASALLGPARLP